MLPFQTCSKGLYEEYLWSHKPRHSINKKYCTAAKSWGRSMRMGCPLYNVILQSMQCFWVLRGIEAICILSVLLFDLHLRLSIINYTFVHIFCWFIRMIKKIEAIPFHSVPNDPVCFPYNKQERVT